MYWCKCLPVYLFLNVRGFVDTIGAAPLHLRLPQELHSECPQQEEEKDQWWWSRVPRPWCGGPWGNVDCNLLLTCVMSRNASGGWKLCFTKLILWYLCLSWFQVDLFQLQVNTLRRYKRHYKLQTRPGLNKAQLAEVNTCKCTAEKAVCIFGVADLNILRSCLSHVLVLWRQMFSLWGRTFSVYDSSEVSGYTWNIHQVVIFVQRFQSVLHTVLYDLTSFYRAYNNCLIGGIYICTPSDLRGNKWLWRLDGWNI